MKARVKETGEIIEIVGEGIQNSNMVMSTHGEWFSKDELDIISLSWKPFEPTYWQKLEHQYAGMAMQTMLATLYNPKYYKELMACYTEVDAEEVARLSKYYAHALVEKMKNTNE